MAEKINGVKTSTNRKKRIRFLVANPRPRPATLVLPAPGKAVADAGPPGDAENSQRPLYHFVILDYLCAAPEGNPKAGGDVTDVAFAAEDELAKFSLTPTATRVIRKAFALSRQNAK